MKLDKKGARWKKVKALILKHRKFTTIFLISLGILGTVIPGMLIDNTRCTRLEIFYYMSQIVTMIFVISSAIVAAWQYYVTSSAELSKIEMEQVQRAIDLSEFYKEKILKPYLAVYYVYQESGILEILQTIDVNRMKNFDTFELDMLLSSEKVEKIREIQYNEKFVKAVLEANDVYGLNLHIRQRIVEVEDGDDIIQIEMHSLLNSFLSGIVSNMLNDLEYFSMHFTHETADETVVFQSLHQTYITIVSQLYFSIAKMNKPTEGKYYTNIIELFEKWYQRSEQQKQTTLKNVRHKTSKGTTINKNN